MVLEVLEFLSSAIRWTIVPTDFQEYFLREIVVVEFQFCFADDFEISAYGHFCSISIGFNEQSETQCKCRWF